MVCVTSHPQILMAATPESEGLITKGNGWSLKRMRDLFPANAHTAVPRQWQCDTFSLRRQQCHRPHSSRGEDMPQSVLVLLPSLSFIPHNGT